MRFLATLLVLLALGPARGQESVSDKSIRQAVQRALPLLQSSARTSAEERRCFTCHNEGLPMLVFREAKQKGFEVDPDLMKELAAHTAAHLERGKSNYLRGVGQGGKADTAGSALWALEAAGHPRDEITDAVIEFLIQRNADTPYWQAQSNRPPSEGSRFTSTFLALRGFEAFALDDRKEAIEKRRGAARDWLVETRAKTHEDRVFRLRALILARAEQAAVEQAISNLAQQQRGEGGWSQLPDLPADAYATGSALAALFDAKFFDPMHTPKGLEFLLDTQLEDGTWHVVSRSRPIQDHYETGFPHGKDQFISAAGTAWATLALLKALPWNEEAVSIGKNAP